MAKKAYHVIASSSSGNAVIYHDEILVDLGVSYKQIEKHKRKLKVVLLTHEHSDHFNPSAIKRLAAKRPTLVWGVPEHLKEKVEELGINNVYYLELRETYKIGDYLISTIELYHNVANVGYRIINTKNDYKIVHATDTYTLDGIAARGYDLYAIEHNYDEETIYQIINEKKENGEYAYEEKAIKNHLSIQAAEKWISENKKETSEVLVLHVSSRYDKEEETSND